MKDEPVWSYSEPLWHDVCYISSMRRDMKHYEVVIEITGHSKKFDCYEEAHEYAENLALETGFEVVVVEINPKASSWLDRYVPITLYDGASGEVKSLWD